MSLLNWLEPIPNLFWEMYDRWISPAVVQALEVDLHEKLLPTLPKGARVLDLGSGGGQHAVRMAQTRPDLQIIGLDIAPVMVKRSRALVAREGLKERVQIELGDALHTPFDNESFDFVLCAGPVKQIADKPGLMRECDRMLRKGGWLMVMDVDRACGYEAANDFARRSTLPGWAKPILRTYFLSVVAAQSIDLEEARALWALLPMENSDGPRRIPGHPALIMVGRKPS